MPLKNYLQCLVAFVAHPGVMGALVPSVTGLCRALVACIEWEQRRTVTEYGPGTGRRTAQIVSRLRPGAGCAAIEIHLECAYLLRCWFPRVQLHQGSVFQVRKRCDVEGIRAVDAMISGWPGVRFACGERPSNLEALFSVLKARGQCAMLAYVVGRFLPTGRRFCRELYQRFVAVYCSRMVWRNLPPAFVYRCYH